MAGIDCVLKTFVICVFHMKIAGGGLTVPRNLRILQWQVCKKKHYQLEFLIPWWDLQLGISANQFLSIFASSNSDFRWDFLVPCP